MTVVDRIKNEVESHPIVLFMKGDPDAPQCGFSAQAAGTLRDLGATDVRTVLDTVIMEDPHVLTERPEELDPLRLVVWTGHVPR